MTTEDLRALSDAELDALAFDTRWQWAVRILGIGLAAVSLGLVGLFFLRTADNRALTERASAAVIEEDYTRCQQANDSRAALRLMRDFVANPNPIDPNRITDPELRAAIAFNQQRAAQFRQELGTVWEARDCEQERLDAIARREADPTTTR